jgi:Fe-S-cluster containining protein
MLTPEESSAFAQSVGNVEAASLRYLASQSDRTATIRFVTHMQRGIDRIVQDDGAAAIACRAGCSHCCSARVEVIAPEAFLVASALRSQGDEGLLARLERHRSSVDDAATSWSARPACPFVVDGLCSIYEFRPSPCRKAHSLDAATCGAGSPTIPQDLRMALRGEALATGTANAYRARGLDADRHEFIGALVVALTDPSAEERWFAGERIFVKLRRGG